MYGFLSEILSDKKGETVFSCFGLWHLCYLLAVAVALTIVIVYTGKKGKEEHQKLSAYFLNGAFGLYIADFFLMPFAYGEIDIEKLPFHDLSRRTDVVSGSFAFLSGDSDIVISWSNDRIWFVGAFV